MPSDDLFTEIDDSFSADLKNNIKTRTTNKTATNKIRSVYDDSSGNNLLKLEYNNDATYRYEHSIDRISRVI